MLILLRRNLVLCDWWDFDTAVQACPMAHKICVGVSIAHVLSAVVFFLLSLLLLGALDLQCRHVRV